MHETPPSPASLQTHRKELEAIEAGVRAIQVPKAFGEQLYNLREHIEYVRLKLAGREGGMAA
jgi:hypothetical protein